ncbi:MAG: hypothetical protein AB7N99_05770 [Simkaniaceae bacterium]
MKKSPHRMKHEQRKAVRQAQKQEYEQEEKVMQEEDIKKNITSSHTNKIVKNKTASKKKSHKTTPGEVTWKTEPDSIHKEGEYWTKTLQKQTIDAAGRLKKKLQKFKLFRKKK